MINNFSTKCDKGYFYINRFISLFIFIIFYAILSFLYYINIMFLLHFLFLFFTIAFIAVPGGFFLFHKKPFPAMIFLYHNGKRLIFL